ncbi:MAG TPA: phosphotransferase [Vineibacter sp.]|nr:phosphotransferase [Vineibacter sp.]
MTSIAIPHAPEELTADWLTQALRASGTGDQVTVASFDYAPIAAGAGFLGRLGRVQPRYAGDAQEAPRSLIAKQPTADARSRQLATIFRFYEREVRFYQELAPRAGIRVPRAYFGGFDPASGDFILLLEDLAPAEVGDQLRACTAEQARIALDGIADVHAAWWRHPDLDALGWMPVVNDPLHHFAEMAYQQCWTPFVDFMGADLPADLRRTGERLGSQVVRMLHAMAERPRTLVHGDYRADNLFFAGRQGGVELAAIDWQVSFRGCGTFDVAYFLSGNVTPDVRRAHERDWLRAYHARLLRGGADGYSFDDCWWDYRFGVLYCLVYAVIVIGTLDPTNARGVALFRDTTGRLATAIAELGAAATMPG